MNSYKDNTPHGVKEDIHNGRFRSTRKMTGKYISPLKKAWHVSTPEERVRQYYIAILANKYGYSLEQMEQELKVNNSKRGQGKARADIVNFGKSEQDKKRQKRLLFIVVECKAENVRFELKIITKDLIMLLGHMQNSLYNKRKRNKIF